MIAYCPLDTFWNEKLPLLSVVVVCTGFVLMATVIAGRLPELPQFCRLIWPLTVNPWPTELVLIVTENCTAPVLAPVATSSAVTVNGMIPGTVGVPPTAR